MQAALAVAGNCHQRYAQAPPHVRRQLNQGFFTKLFIARDGSVERAELTEPFASLMDHELGAPDWQTGGRCPERPGGVEPCPDDGDTAPGARRRQGRFGQRPALSQERAGQPAWE